jgi:hypothetical protein
MPPSWVLPGAAIDLDFKNLRWWGGYVAICDATVKKYQGSLVITETALTNAFIPDNNGLLVNVPVNIPRVVRGTGLWAEAGRTNSVLWCRDLTNAAWTKTNATASKNQTGADGTVNGASSITATADAGTITQAITLASGVRTFSAYIKRLSGSGTLEMTLDGGSTWTSISPTTSYQRFVTPSQTLANPTVGFRLGTNGDSFAIDFCQNDTDKLTSPIATTSTTVQRFSEEPTFNTTGSRNNDGLRVIKGIMAGGIPWSGYAEFSGNPENLGSVFVTDANILLTGGANGGTCSFGIGANSVTSANNGNAGLGNMNKVAWRTDGGGGALCLNSGAIATNSLVKPVTTAITHAGLGNNGNGTYALNGYISRLTFWKNSIPNGMLSELTR